MGVKAQTILFVTVCSLSRAAMAGGTLTAGEVFAIIQQRKEISDFLASSLEFRCTAFADVRLGGEVVPALGGKRIGPYTLWARGRGSKGGWTLQLTVETHATWQDASGAELPAERFPMATAVREEIDGVRIKPCSETCDAQAEEKPCLMVSGANPR